MGWYLTLIWTDQMDKTGYKSTIQNVQYGFDGYNNYKNSHIGPCTVLSNQLGPMWYLKIKISAGLILNL